MINFYGLFMALAFLVGSFEVWRRAKEEAFESEKIFDGIVITVLLGLLGARIHFVLLNFEHFGFNLLRWLWLTKYAGLRFHGGLLGGIFGLFLFTKREKWDFWQTADIAVLGLSLGQAIGRIGCFFNEKDLTQIYESIFVMLIFYLLLRLERRYRLFVWYKGKKDKAAPGFLGLSYLIIYNLGRIFLETLRGERVYWSGLIVLVALVCLYQRSGRELQKDKRLVINRCLLSMNELKYRIKTLRRKEKRRRKRIKVGEDVK